jgi:hypothetical protein
VCLVCSYVSLCAGAEPNQSRMVLKALADFTIEFIAYPHIYPHEDFARRFGSEGLPAVGVFIHFEQRATMFSLRSNFGSSAGRLFRQIEMISQGNSGRPRRQVYVSRADAILSAVARLTFLGIASPPTTTLIEILNERFRAYCLSAHWFTSIAHTRFILTHDYGREPWLPA